MSLPYSIDENGVVRVEGEPLPLASDEKLAIGYRAGGGDLIAHGRQAYVEKAVAHHNSRGARLGLAVPPSADGFEKDGRILYLAPCRQAVDTLNDVVEEPARVLKWAAGMG